MVDIEQPKLPDSPDSEYDELRLPEVDNLEALDHVGDTEIKSKITDTGVYFPFDLIHESQSSFRSPSRIGFLPDVDVTVKIVDVLKTPHNILSPYLYTINIQHGNHEWTIYRRYKHFLNLHHALQIFYTTVHLPLPMRKHKERRKTLKMRKIDKNIKPPRFPKKSDLLIHSDQITSRMQQLEEYLQMLLQIPLYRNHYETLDFLEISPYSFVYELGKKRKEGFLKKRAGGYRTVTGLFWCCFVCRNWFSNFTVRWLIIKDSYLAYVHSNTGKVHFVILMDHGFDVHTGLYQTGIKHGILISNLTRRLLLKCHSARNTKEWFEQIMNVVQDTGKEFIEPVRFESFAPVRENTLTHWYVDGAGYFEDIANALEAAREEIFITDWWLSPEIFLKRPSLDGQKWRLDKILQRKAEEGVKIFVLLYKEVEWAFGLNSLYSKQRLVEKHPLNIKVLRHPDMTQTTLFWAHHEKIVVVDQTYAFLGGLDLCYGRWDTQDHRLTDLGGVTRKKNSQPSNQNEKIPLSQNFSGFGAFNIFQLVHATQNISLAPITRIPSNNLEKRSMSQRMHAFKTKRSSSFTSSSSLLSSRHSVCSSSITNLDNSDETYSCIDDIEDKSYYQSQERRRPWHRRNRSLDSFDILAAKPKATFQHIEDSTDSLVHASSEPLFEHMNNAKFWIGKDYANFIVRDFVDLDSPFQDLVDRTTTPRMPWHDIGVMVQGKAARDVARHFIQRWNFTKSEKAKDHPSYPWLLPKSYTEVNNIPFQIRKKFGNVSCQVLRSVSTWSAGITCTEDSIHKAYLHAIENSKHFIYIENQFFISQPAGNKDVYNGIADALYNRIIRAFKERTPFRVYVVLPLLPAFEGEIGTNRGTAIQAITHWNFASICRGENSLLGRLSREVPDPTEYISFYGLRNHGVLNENLVTELVYVHSKLMIVDDSIAIIGSANLNDRSLLGKRDSEIAVYLEDMVLKPGLMGGKETVVGRVIRKLRLRIFREFLGILKSNPQEIDINDPISDNFFKEIWIKTAALNTSLFEKVFQCLPTDAVHDFNQLKRYQSKIPLAVTNPSLAMETLSRVQGLLVLFPLQFLCKESLEPGTGTKEALLPTSLWV